MIFKMLLFGESCFQYCISRSNMHIFFFTWCSRGYINLLKLEISENQEKAEINNDWLIAGMIKTVLLVIL